MTLASDIITQALREGNIIPVGQSPTSAESAEALPRLNAILAGVFGYEMGEQLADWLVPAPQRTAPVAANYPQLPYPQGLDGSLLALPINYDPTIQVFPYPPKNSRIVYDGKAAQTVYFPEAPDDGSRMGLICGGSPVGASTITLNGNGRTIGGAATQAYSVIGGTIAPKQWLYRADLGDWLLIAPLASGDTFPFPIDVEDVFICMLAVRLAPRFGKVIGDGTITTLKNAMAHFKARYKQAGTTVFGSQDFPRALESFISGRWFYAIPALVLFPWHLLEGLSW